jgi:hypothetical protein
MGATFTKTGEWQGDVNGGYETATKVAGLPEPDEGKIYRRKRNISSRWRNGQGLTSWTNSAGTEIYGDDLTITNGPDTTSWAGEPKYLITQNELQADPPGSGIWKEIMVAENYTDWAQWTIPTETAPPEE